MVLDLINLYSLIKINGNCKSHLFYWTRHHFKPQISDRVIELCMVKCVCLGGAELEFSLSPSGPYCPGLPKINELKTKTNLEYSPPISMWNDALDQSNGPSDSERTSSMAVVTVQRLNNPLDWPHILSAAVPGRWHRFDTDQNRRTCKISAQKSMLTDSGFTSVSLPFIL